MAVLVKRLMAGRGAGNSRHWQHEAVDAQERDTGTDRGSTMTADRRGIGVFVRAMSGGMSAMIVLTMMGCVGLLGRVSLGHRYQERKRKRHRQYGEQSAQR
ncbi:MAG: hypothetical protein H8D70_02480 [Rhodospirillaceae bacterium]|nr:hypothetical protein [Rhodospirillaceae bacterium]